MSGECGDTQGVAESLKSKDSQNLWLRSWNCLESIATLLSCSSLPWLLILPWVSINMHLYNKPFSKGNLSELPFVGGVSALGSLRIVHELQGIQLFEAHYPFLWPAHMEVSWHAWIQSGAEAQSTTPAIHILFFYSTF